MEAALEHFAEQKGWLLEDMKRRKELADAEQANGSKQARRSP